MAQNIIPSSGLWSTIAGYLNDNFSEIQEATQVSGVYNYSDAETAGTPIAISADTWTLLTNDGAGADTVTTYGIATIPNIFNTVTDVFDFSSLALGDSVDVRTDLTVTTTSPNQEVELEIFAAIGSGNDYTIPLVTPIIFKTAGEHKLIAFNGGFIGETSTRDNPANIQIKSDASASVVVNGWYIRVIRRGI